MAASSSVLGSSLFGLCALVLLSPSTAAGEAVATELDPGVVRAIAGDGRAVAWLRTEREGSEVTLWTWDGAGPARHIDQGLPRNTSEVAIGRDAARRQTIVLAASPGSDGNGPDTLYALPADGTAAPQKLRASNAAGAESAPGLHDGVLSFSRFERTRRRGKMHATVRLGSLRSSRSRVVWDGERGTGIQLTTPTAGSGVAFVTTSSDGDRSEYELRVLRAGRRSRVLSTITHGAMSIAGYGTLVVSDVGRVLTATRWSVGGGSRANRASYRVPAGTPIGAPLPLAPGEVSYGVGVDGGTVYVDTRQPEPSPSEIPDGRLVFLPDDRTGQEASVGRGRRELPGRGELAPYGVGTGDGYSNDCPPVRIVKL